MAPNINWDIINSIADDDKEDEDDDNLMEEGIEIIRSVAGQDYEDDLEKCSSLFKAAQKVLLYREQGIEELIQGNEALVEEKENEIDDLKKQLYDRDDLVMDDGMPKDTDYYKMENKRLLEGLDILQEQMDDLRKEHEFAQNDRDKCERELQELRRLNQALKTNIKDLNSQLRDYQDVLERQTNKRFTIEATSDSKEKLQKKNQQISELISQLTLIEQKNNELEGDNKTMLEEMEKGKEEFDRMLVEYEKIKLEIHNSDEDLGKIQSENRHLKLQVEDLIKKKEEKSREDEDVAAAFNEKIMEWKEKMKSRDDIILEQSRDIISLRDKVQTLTSSLHHDRSANFSMKKIDEKDEVIKKLQKELQQATKDLLDQTEVVEDMKVGDDVGGMSREASRLRQKIKQLQQETDDLKKQVEDARYQQKEAEEEANENDLKLTEALKKVSYLESGQYGLTEAINEIKDWKISNQHKELQIQKLTQEANLLDDKLNDLLEENEDFRERLGLDLRKAEDMITLKNNRFLRQQQFRSENQILLKEVERLEDERIEMKKQIRRLAQSNSQKAVSEGLSVEDVQLVDDFIEELKQNRYNKKSPNIAFLTIQRTQNEMIKLKELKRKVVDENNQLRVAMNDILMDLKMVDKQPSNRNISHLPSIKHLVEMLQHRPYQESGVAISTDEKPVLKMKKENELLRSAVLDVFAELKKVQKTSNLKEALQIPSVERFFRMLKRKLTNENMDYLQIENNQIKVALKEVLSCLKKSQRVFSVEEAIKLPAVQKLVQIVDNQSKSCYKRKPEPVEPEVVDAFKHVVDILCKMKPVPSVNQLQSIPQFVHLLKLLEKTPGQHHIKKENFQIKSTLTEILSKLKGSTKLPTIEESLNLPSVLKLMKILEEGSFENRFESTGSARKSLQDAMIEILAALQGPDQSSNKIFSIKEVSNLFQYSVEADLKKAMLAILDLLKSSNKKPAIEDIYILPKVSKLLQNSSQKKENLNLRSAIKEVLISIQDSHQNLSVDDIIRLPEMCKFLQMKISSDEERANQVLEDLINSLRSIPPNPIPSNEDLLNLPNIHQLLSRSDLNSLPNSEQVIGSVKELRHQLNLAKIERLKLEKDNFRLLEQVRDLKEKQEGRDREFAHQTRQLSVVALPKHRDFTSDDVINALNEQLIMTLKDASQREKSSREMKESLDASRRQLDVLRHQTHLLYKEHFNEKEKFSSKIEKIEKEKENLRIINEDQKIKIEEFNNLIEILNKDPDKRQEKLAEIIRQQALLRINQQSLIRHHKASEANEEILRKENLRLKKEIGSIEKEVVERIGFLERHKSVAVHKIALLQKSLEASVNESDLDLLNRRFNDLTCKYRSLLQRENESEKRSLQVEELQEEIKILREQEESLKSELKIEKEKRMLLEETVEMGGRSVEKSLHSSEGSFMKKLALLEMKELNERQRANHSTKMFHQLKSSIDQLQERNVELEEKFSQLTKLNLASQQTERDLRDELASVVPKNVCEDERRRLAKAQHELVKYKLKISQSQQVTEIAQNQLKVVQHQQESREREMTSLREQIRIFQIKSDENLIIGKLHSEILMLQDSVADYGRKLEMAEKETEKMKIKLIRVETEADENENLLYLSRSEAVNKHRQLRKTIENLRRQFSGSIPLTQLEKFTSCMNRLRDDKAKVYDELRRVKIAREVVEERLSRLDVESCSAKEVQQAIKENKTSEKILEWCSRMDKLRLEDLKLQRQVVRQGEQIKYFENLNLKQEKTISSLEENIVELLRAQESHQIEWERREDELEKMLEDLQTKQHQVHKKALKMDNLSCVLPNPTLSKDVQIANAVETIKSQSEAVQTLKVKSKMLEDECERLKDERFKLNCDVMSRDRIINELRLNLPFTKASDQIASDSIGYRSEQLEIARDQISSLNDRLKLKEENLAEMKIKVESVERMKEDLHQKYQEDIKIFERKIESIRKESNETNRNINIPVRGPTVSSYSKDQKIIELEDLLEEQNATISKLMERIRNANSEIIQLKNDNFQRNEKIEEKKDDETFASQKMKLEKLVHALRVKLAKKHSKVQQLEQEIELLKENQKSEEPSLKVLKQLIAKLKSQLAEKEKQLQAMNRALSDLRSDIVQQAQENLRAASAEKEDIILSKDLLEKKKKHFKEHIEKLKDENAGLEVKIKKMEQTEKLLRCELMKILKETEEKEIEIRRLQTQINKKIKNGSQPLCSGGIDEDPIKVSADADQEIFKSEDVMPEKKRPIVRKTLYMDNRGQVDLLKKENQRLKEEIERLNQRCNNSTDKNSVEIAKWETRKLFNKKVDTLKTKLKEKEENLNILEKQLASSKETIKRLEKQRNKLNSRKVDEKTSVGQEVLERQVKELQKENEYLNEQDRKTLNQLEEQNSVLQNQLNQLYQSSKKTSNKTKEVKDLEDQLIKITSDYKQLKFDFDKLQSKQLIQKAVNGTEMDSTKQIDKTSSHKKINELESRVKMLKNIIERVERENKQLKLAPGVVSKKQVEKLQSENEILKLRVHEVTQEVGGELSGRYQSKVKSVDKLVQENKKLRCEVDQVKLLLEKTRESKNKIQNNKDKIAKDFEEMKKKLIVAENKVPKVSGSGHKGYQSAVTAKVFETKVKRLEVELDKKTKEVKVLKEKVESNNVYFEKLNEENEGLKDQIEVLERFPPGVGDCDSNITKELQISRLTVARLENENEELKHVIEILKKKIEPQFEGNDTEENKLKVSECEKVELKAENIRIETEIKIKIEENMKLQKEIENLKSQLNNFNEEFFEEIEDLKYNYSQSVKKNLLYENQLKVYSKQFGFEINLLDED